MILKKKKKTPWSPLKLLVLGGFKFLSLQRVKSSRFPVQIQMWVLILSSSEQMCSPPLKQGPNGYNAPKQLPSAMILKSYTHTETQGGQWHTQFVYMKWESLTSTRGKRKKCTRDGQRPISQPPWLIEPPRVGCPTRRPICYHCHQTEPSSPTVFPQERYFRFTISQLWLCEQHFQMSVGGVNMNHTHTHTQFIVPLTITWPLCVCIYLHNNWGLVFLATGQLSAQISAELCRCTPRLTATHARSSTLWQAHTRHVLELHHSQPRTSAAP